MHRTSHPPPLPCLRRQPPTASHCLRPPPTVSASASGRRRLRLHLHLHLRPSPAASVCSASSPPPAASNSASDRQISPDPAGVAASAMRAIIIARAMNRRAPDGRPKFSWPTCRDGMLENGLRTDALSCFEMVVQPVLEHKIATSFFLWSHENSGKREVFKHNMTWVRNPTTCGYQANSNIFQGLKHKQCGI